MRGMYPQSLLFHEVKFAVIVWTFDLQSRPTPNKIGFLAIREEGRASAILL